MHNPSSINLRTELLQAWQQEQWLAQFLTRIANVVGLATLLGLFVLLFVGGYDHFGLVTMSVYSIGTRLGAILIHRIFLYPRLLAECASPDPRRRQAARDLAERHRAQLLGDIARERLLQSNADGLAHLSWDEIAAWPEVGDIDRWRRVGKICLGIWLAASLGLYVFLRSILT